MVEGRPIVIFDFDCTIVDVDSDPWVAQQLGAIALMDNLRCCLPWNDMMNALMEALHTEGKTIHEIEEALRRIPLQPEKISAIKLAHSKGCELHIVSDANSFFIKTILDEYNVTQLFTGIHTNPATVDTTGRLHIGPFHSKCKDLHGCPNCPPNMCKGIILNDIQSQMSQHRKIIYIGDGCGDFCPSLRLKEEDYLLPREGFPLLGMLLQNIHKVKAKVCPWGTAKNLEELVGTLMEAPRILAEHGLENLSDENCAHNLVKLEQQAKAVAAKS